MVTTSPYCKSILIVASNRFFWRHIESMYHFFTISFVPFLFLSFVFLFVGVTLDGYTGRFPCAWLPSKRLSNEIAESVVHFLTPGWFDSRRWSVLCLPKRLKMWYVFWPLVFILLFSCILTLLPRGWISRASYHSEFWVHVDLLLLLLLLLLLTLFYCY